jgi:hypothetical protein
VVGDLSNLKLVPAEFWSPGTPRKLGEISSELGLINAKRYAVDRYLSWIDKAFLSSCPLRLFALQLIPIARSRSRCSRGASIGEATPRSSRLVLRRQLSGASKSRTPAQPLCCRPDADPPALFFSCRNKRHRTPSPGALPDGPNTTLEL